MSVRTSCSSSIDNSGLMCHYRLYVYEALQIWHMVLHRIRQCNWAGIRNLLAKCKAYRLAPLKAFYVHIQQSICSACPSTLFFLSETGVELSGKCCKLQVVTPWDPMFEGLVNWREWRRSTIAPALSNSPPPRKRKKNFCFKYLLKDCIAKFRVDFPSFFLGGGGPNHCIRLQM